MRGEGRGMRDREREYREDLATKGTERWQERGTGGTKREYRVRVHHEGREEHESMERELKISIDNHSFCASFRSFLCFLW